MSKRTNEADTKKTAPTFETLRTLRVLATASRKSFTLDLYHAYNNVPTGHVETLVAAGLWYCSSATQGNITEAGYEALCQ